jgi:hypothetical protein
MAYESLDPLYQKHLSVQESRTRQSVYNLGRISAKSLEVLTTVGALGFALANKESILQTLDRYDVYGALTALAVIAGASLIRRSLTNTHEKEKKRGEKLENSLRLRVHDFLSECKEGAPLGFLGSSDREQLQRGVDHGYIEFGEAREIRDLAKRAESRRKRGRPSYSDRKDAEVELGFLPPSDDFLPPKDWKPRKED